MARASTFPTRRRPASTTGRWLVGLVLTMVVSVPSMIVEEDWHGHPMIDLGTLLWIPFAVLVALAFLAGGAIAAGAPSLRRSTATRWAAAFGVGLSCGLAAILTLVACDLLRRFVVLREGLSPGVVELWIVAGSGVTVLSGIGGTIGHALARRSRRRPARL